MTGMAEVLARVVAVATLVLAVGVLLAVGIVRWVLGPLRGQKGPR